MNTNINKKAVLELAVGIGFLLLLQGGYFPEAYLPVGMVLSMVILLQSRRPDPNYKIIGLLAGILLLYLVSGVINRIDGRQYVRLFYIGDIILFYIWLCQKTYSQREIEVGVSYAVAVMEFIGMLAYLGCPFSGVILSNRFMGTSQYANVTAMILCVSMLLLKSGQVEEMQRLRLIHAVFFLLTLSVGGFLIYGGIICYLMWHDPVDRKKRFCRELLFWLVAAIVAVLIYGTCFFLRQRLATAVVFFILIWISGKWTEFENRLLSAKWVAGVSIGSLFMGVVAVVCLIRQRAAATLMERMQQMQDGIRVLSRNPLFGIGMGEWSRQQDQYRTYDYSVSLIHNTYLQVGVDAGLLAMVLVCLLIYYEIRYLQKEKNIYKKAILFGAFLHGFVDVDGFFLGYMVILLMVLKSTQNTKQEAMQMKYRLWFVPIVLLYGFAWFRYVSGR